MQREYDEDMYKIRHPVERNSFIKLKQFVGIATRYDKLDGSTVLERRCWMQFVHHLVYDILY